VTQFLSLFHRFGYIYKPFGKTGWLSANEEWQLTDSEILKAIACVHPKYFIGTRPSRATRFAVIDIDAGSRYHSPAAVKKITSLLETAGLPGSVIYQSSDSGGLHIYIFFDEPISCRDLHKQLFQLFKLQSFEIAKGTLEIFPHPGHNSMGQGLRLPMQPGFAWLNHDNLTVIQERIGMAPLEALRTFLRDIECTSNSRHQFHKFRAYIEKMSVRKQEIEERETFAFRPGEVIPIRNYVKAPSSDEAQSLVRSVFQKIPPGIIPDNWAKGRHYYLNGLTGPNQRAEAIFCLGHYLFYGDPSRGLEPLGYGYESERKWAVEAILKTKHHGYSKDISNGRGDAIAQVDRATNWVPPHRRGVEATKYVPQVPVVFAKANAKRAMAAREKIAAAVKDFEQSHQTFSMRDLWERTGCGTSTLQRHADLWKPVQQRLFQARFASDPGVYNAGVGGVSEKTTPSSLDSKKEMPGGRLAARRIVDEIKMRAEREQKKKARARTDFYDSYGRRWKDSLEAIHVDNLQEVDTSALRARLAVALHLLAIAATEDDASLVSARIVTLRQELSLRPAGPSAVACDPNSQLHSRPAWKPDL